MNWFEKYLASKFKWAWGLIGHGHQGEKTSREDVQISVLVVDVCKEELTVNLNLLFLESPAYEVGTWLVPANVIGK